MNCQEALDLLYDIIDKEASEIDAQEVKRHLDQCQDCFKHFQLHGAIQSLLSEKLKPETNTPAIERMRGNILSKLDEIDSERQSSSAKTVPFRMPAIALAAAAAVILFVATGFFANNLYDHYTRYIPIERAHWAADENADNFESAEETASVIAAVSKDFGLTMTATEGGLNLVGGASHEIEGMKVSQFYYSDGENSASVFVIPASQITFAEDLLKASKELSGDCFHDHNCRGCRLIFSKNGDAVIITASTNRAYRLSEFDPVSRII